MKLVANYGWSILGTLICFMYHCLTWRHGSVPRKNFEFASAIWKGCGPKKVALKEVIELIMFAFGRHVLTCNPLKLQNVTHSERTFSSSFRKLSNGMAKFCAQQKDRTRRLWLLVRCRNLWSNEGLPENAFQTYFSANVTTCSKKCDCNF